MWSDAYGAIGEANRLIVDGTGGAAGTATAQSNESFRCLEINGLFAELKYLQHLVLMLNNQIELKLTTNLSF